MESTGYELQCGDPDPASPVSTSFSALEKDDLSRAFGELMGERRLHALYQPIAHLHRHSILGYEALIRGPSDSPLHNPLALLEAAQRLDRLFELEILCRETCMGQFRKLRLEGKLFLNCSPASLLQADHRPGQTLEIVRSLGLEPQNVVIELTEQFPLDDYELVREATHHYKSMGFEIAIDDLGAGYAGLRMWSELRPDYVKIDRHFIQGIHEDPVKQEFVRSILDIAQGLGCKVIAEGIETADEYRAVCRMGIEIGQGYYFARPHALPPRQLPPDLFVCDANERCSARVRLSESVACLLREAPFVHPSTAVERVFELFSSLPTLQSLPVLDDARQPVGLVRRHELSDVLASRYGRPLHAKKPIARLLGEPPLLVERDMLVEQASQLVTDAMQLRLEDDFIITDGGRYAGMARVVDLLKKITDLQIRNARYANPLTLLPGNVPIYETLDRLLQERAAFAVAYCDLDNFKPFNDVYGYGKGDQVLQRVAAILSAHADPRHDFVGHLGGDDFIVTFASTDWRERCAAALNQFAAEIPGFYSELDRQRGGIEAVDRRGAATFYPLLSLSIGVVCPDPLRCHSHNEVAAMASDAKRQAKAISGDSLFVDRRNGP